MLCILCIIFWCGVFSFECVCFVLVCSLSCLVLDLQKLTSTLVYISFVNGANHNTQNLTSITWVIFSPTYALVSLGGICLSPTTNNVVEYSAIIKLLSKSIALGIHKLVVRLDSQRMILQLNHVYSIQNLTHFCKYLRVRPLEKHFNYIMHQ